MMKTLLFLLTVWGVLGLVQCKKDADGEAQLNQEIQLRQKKSTTVVTPGANVHLTLTKIADSRCPTGLTCVWQGAAEVAVELRDGAGVVQTAALCLGGCRNDSAAVVLDAVPYWLRLTAVEPYPSAATNNVPQTATLYLTRQ